MSPLHSQLPLPPHTHTHSPAHSLPLQRFWSQGGLWDLGSLGADWEQEALPKS